MDRAWPNGMRTVCYNASLSESASHRHLLASATGGPFHSSQAKAKNGFKYLEVVKLAVRNLVKLLSMRNQIFFSARSDMYMSTGMHA